MFMHAPSCLQGPYTRSRCWWHASRAEWMTTPYPESDTAETPPVSEEFPSSDIPIRTELVERVRREIAQGTYDTPEKWEIALDRLLNKLES